MPLKTRLTRDNCSCLVLVVAVGGYLGTSFSGRMAILTLDRLVPATVTAKNIAIEANSYMLAIVDSQLRTAGKVDTSRKAIDDNIARLEALICSNRSDTPNPEVVRMIEAIKTTWSAMKVIGVEEIAASVKEQKIDRQPAN